MDIYYLKPNRLVVEAENESDRLKLRILEPEIRKLIREFDNKLQQSPKLRRLVMGEPNAQN